MKVRGNGLQVGDRLRFGRQAGTVKEIVKYWRGNPSVVLFRDDAGFECEIHVTYLERS